VCGDGQLGALGGRVEEVDCAPGIGAAPNERIASCVVHLPYRTTRFGVAESLSKLEKLPKPAPTVRGTERLIKKLCF
jgi:hypothetical protein